MHELLTPQEMAQADRASIATGPFDGYRLMCNAGEAVVEQVLRRYPWAAAVDILCGPGNNGGDGYVVGRLLQWRGIPVRLWREAPPAEGGDAFQAAQAWEGEARSLGDFRISADTLVVDALFGAGLTRELEGPYAAAVAKTAEARATVVAIDLPSGISGATGTVMGTAFRADLTVTFFRKKPGHLLFPGRSHCGEVVVADIGIGPGVLGDIGPSCFENGPALWRATLPRPEIDTHKYRRGHVAVLSGPSGSTGAARLSAKGAARAGAGAVTVLSPGEALLVNAAHLTAIMLRRVDDVDGLVTFIGERRPSAIVLGPGFGALEKARIFVLNVLEARDAGAAPLLVLDADGITAFRDRPEALFAASRAGATRLVLTPHSGEFARLFPDLANDESLSKLDRARLAAKSANAIVIFKGADSVIAAPDGRAAINANGAPWLATAGSGDVLCGIVAGLAAQGMPAFEAACAAVWIHAEAGSNFGAGLIAEDLPELLPPILQAFLATDNSEGDDA